MLVSMANAELVDSFEVGAPVYVLMKGEMVKGLYAGVSREGRESMIVTDPNTLFEMHFPVSFPKGFMKPDPNPSVPPVLVRRPPVPKPPVPVPVPVPIPNPSEVQEALEEGAIEEFVTRAAYVATERVNLREKMSTRTGQYSVRFRIPAFVLVQVGGRTMRSSVPFALSKRTEDFRTRLLERLGFVPLGTYVRLNWEFERGPNGKPLEQDGDVNIRFMLGNKVQKY